LERKGSGLVTVSSARVDGKLVHLLALPQAFNFLTDKIPEAVKSNEALRFCSHEQVAPNVGSPNRVVDGESKRGVDFEDTLGDSFGRRATRQTITSSCPQRLGEKILHGNDAEFLTVESWLPLLGTKRQKLRASLPQWMVWVLYGFWSRQGSHPTGEEVKGTNSRSTSSVNDNIET